MAFYHRKLLPLHNSRDATKTEVWGTNCRPEPSPLHSPELGSQPVSLPLRRSSDRFDNPVDQYHLLQVAMIAIVCTVGVILFLLTMIKFLGNYYSRRYYLRRRNAPILFDIHGDPPSSDDERTPIDHPIWYINTVGLQQSVIDSITVCKYRKDEGLIEGTECSVCLGEFQEEESLRLLPKCSHAFHVPCIDTWLRSHKNCPLCRAPIVHDTSATEVSVTLTEPDSNLSDQTQNEDTQIENLDAGAGNHHLEEGEHSGLRVGDDCSGIFTAEDGGKSEAQDQNLLNSTKIKNHPPILVEEEIQPVRRSVSVDYCSASIIYGAVMDLNSDRESSDTHSSGNSKSAAIAKQGSGSSTIYKPASIGRALQKWPISLKRSSSSNRKFGVSKHGRSQSSTLPL